MDPIRKSADTPRGRPVRSVLFKALMSLPWLTRRKRQGSLVRRFLILLLSWGVSIYLLSVAGFWLTSSQTLQSAFSHQARQWIVAFDEMSAPLYVSRDASDFAPIESFARTLRELAYVRFYDADGQTLIAEYLSPASRAADTGRELFASFDADTFRHFSREDLQQGRTLLEKHPQERALLRIAVPVTAASTETEALLDVSAGEPVAEMPRVIGYIELAVDFSAYYETMVTSTLWGSLVVLILFLLAAVLGRLLITRALKPLLDLREPLVRLARGDTDIAVDREGDEEIVAITNALSATISAIRGRDEELRRLADYDALTGLINKRSFNQLLVRERARVVTERDTSALFFIDLDQFKYVNDTLGHAAGDRLLVQVGELLNRRMRSGDAVARLGGDEFAVLARSVNRGGAIEIAASIVKALQEVLFVDSGRTFNICCSVGVALIEVDSEGTEALFSHADMACYAAKSAGRNRFCIYEADMSEYSKLDIGWSQRIAKALSEDSFVLEFQPVVAIDSRQLPGYEVLVRLRDEDHGLVPPGMFIPVAERFGLATEIDFWVIRESMRVLAEAARKGEEFELFINLSGQLISDPSFVERVDALHSEYSISSRHIVFELTERAAVGNLKVASARMDALRERGFRFAIDDFGAGYSSFAYLKHMPVDIVKIEGEFVESMKEDSVNRAMVKSMVDIAKACGKRVVAEYVCDEETLDILREFGVDFVQGFYIARPAATRIPAALKDSSLPANVATILSRQRGS